MDSHVAEWSSIHWPVQEMQETGVHSLGWESPLEQETTNTPVFLPEESCGRRAWQATCMGVPERRAQLSI